MLCEGRVFVSEHHGGKVVSTAIFLDFQEGSRASKPLPGFRCGCDEGDLSASSSKTPAFHGGSKVLDGGRGDVFDVLLHQISVAVIGLVDLLGRDPLQVKPELWRDHVGRRDIRPDLGTTGDQDLGELLVFLQQRKSGHAVRGLLVLELLDSLLELSGLGRGGFVAAVDAGREPADLALQGRDLGPDADDGVLLVLGEGADAGEQRKKGDGEAEGDAVHGDLSPCCSRTRCGRSLFMEPPRYLLQGIVDLGDKNRQQYIFSGFYRLSLFSFLICNEHKYLITTSFLYIMLVFAIWQRIDKKDDDDSH